MSWTPKLSQDNDLDCPKASVKCFHKTTSKLFQVCPHLLNKLCLQAAIAKKRSLVSTSRVLGNQLKNFEQHEMKCYDHCDT